MTMKTTAGCLFKRTIRTWVNKSWFYPVLLLLLCQGLSSAQNLNPTGDVTVHDPVMIRHENTYYVFHTGNGISVKSSKDMISWTEEKPVFENTPSWVLETIPSFEKSMWAPDIIFQDGIYYLYYSVSAFGRNTSAIGVATNTTLDPNDTEFRWVDRGKVVESVPGRDMWNAIDPNIAIDENGTPWMTFGSFWMGIKLVKLQSNMTQVVSGPSQEWFTIAARERDFGIDERDAGDSANPELDYENLYGPEQLERNRNMQNGAIEAPFIFKKNGYYYLFVSWDRCCRGVNSTYKILVGRSKDIRGPYLDKNGKNMTYGGGTLIADGNDRWAAVGHQAAYTIDGRDYLIFHAYDRNDNGRSKLLIKEISWDENGWPGISL